MSNEFEETYDEPAAPAPREPQRAPGADWTKNRGAWLVTAVVVLAAVALVVYFAAIRNTGSSKGAGGPTSTTSATGGHYHVRYPKSWKPVNANAVAPGEHAFAAFRQKKGKGLVVMRVEGKVTDLTGAYLQGLESQLKQSVSDYKLVSAHTIPLQGSTALDLAYERTSLNQVRNVVVLPVGATSIVMATVAPAGDATITSQINEIVSSFTLSSS